ncbi:GPI inositol deacylase [Podila humilis]|nr:GPI inositol deacylase [Podila humilis]
MAGLLLSGLDMRLSTQSSMLTSTLRLPNINSGLLAYTLTVDRKRCRENGEYTRASWLDSLSQSFQCTNSINRTSFVTAVRSRFSTMMRQSSWNMHEDRYTVNIDSKSYSTIDINFHGDAPYHTRTFQPDKKGIELQFWTDPSSCSEPLSMTLRVDIYGSLGKILIRYRMVVLVFTFLVVALTLQAQHNRWNNGESFESFGETIQRLIGSQFWKFSLILGAIAAAQSLLAGDPIEFGGLGINGSPNLGIMWLVERQMSLIIRDMLLGGGDAFFWFLAPVFFQIAVGITILIWLVLHTLVRLVSYGLDFATCSKHQTRTVPSLQNTTTQEQ